ncbi:L-2-hydroxyglutarate oxidase [bacterium]|nr:L-2-hydroxyglutarate oxidase [bacterium]
MKECKFLIIGAGIIGLTITRELLQRGHKDILLLEKEPGPGFHASGRNSGVLHAGIYYSTDSLKARFCIDGNRMMKEYCRSKNLALVESGKVIVALKEAHLSGLHELKNRAERNGAIVHLIDSNELKKLEPYASTYKDALHSPNTAVIDPLQILIALQKEIEDSGRAAILFNSELAGIESDRTVRTSQGSIRFEKLINAAGTYADRIAHQMNLGNEYRIQPFKGTYQQLKREELVNGNIYSVPDLKNPFLGIHFCKNAHGQVTLGPTAIPALSRENYGPFENLEPETFSILYRDAILLAQNPAFRNAASVQLRKYSKKVLFEEAHAMVPDLKLEDLQPSNKVGIRAQFVHWPTRELVMDFIVLQNAHSVHVLNAVSPAFTSSMAFAKYVADQI